MSTNEFIPITPEQVYGGLVEDPGENVRRLSDIIGRNKASGNNYIDLFADTVRRHGKREATSYAKMMGADFRYFDGAIRCLAGMTAHQWINRYVGLIARDLVEHTNLNFKTISQLLGFSQSSFSQFFRANNRMQPWEYRNLKRHGRKRGFFYG